MSKRLLPLLLLIFILSAFFCVSTTTAESTVNFADTNMVNCQFWVYQANGTFMGQYNSTDTAVIIPTNAIIVIKPGPTDVLKNWQLLPDFAMGMVPAAASLFAVCAFIGLVWLVFFRR